ncbi:hypothetical protein T01_14184 [Trichinella spiralis]|uniref:Uncharacterized protein n=1 Tax=Trichinella spiralis TaxID=6334 RepID=A0A0V1B938_TRISP|nr:hypothetical protein T01_14184 [Trichinella spiralis]
MSDYPKIRLSEGPPKIRNILKTRVSPLRIENSMIPCDGPQTKKMLQHENLLSTLVGSHIYCYGMVWTPNLNIHSRSHYDYSFIVLNENT